MRALIPSLVLLAACGKIFGIEHIPYSPDASTPPTAAAPDAPPTAAMLQAGQPAYDFGDVTLGHASFAIAVDISNVGNAATGTLTVSKTDDSDFSVTGDDCSGHSLAAGGSCTLMITFSPGDAGAKTSTLTVADGSTSAATTLQGNALIPGALDISPSPLDFGRHKVGGTSAPVTVTLENTGETPITVMSLALSDTTSFAYDASGCTLPKLLAAHAKCTVALTFSPNLGGSHVASLTATTDAASNNMTSVSMGGTGTSTITITRSSGGTGTITSGDASITCGATCTATFATPTVTFTVAPDMYNQFQAWSANCLPVDKPTCTVATTTAAIGVDASIVAWPTLSLKVTGSAGSVSGWGGNCQTGNTCVARFAPGTMVTLTPGGPDAFNLWTGHDCTQQNSTFANAGYPSCAFQITGDSMETADFTNDYAIDIIDQSTAIDAAAGVTISPADRYGNSYCASGNTCTFHYADATPVTLTGTSGKCAQFTSFAGACAANPCMLTPAAMSTQINASYAGVTDSGC